MPRYFGQAATPAIPADPLKAQGFRTQRAELPEDLWQPLYDRVNYPNVGATSLSFFSTPRGQSATLITGVGAAAAKIKDFRDTNMENANVVPTKMFKFMGVSLGLINQVPGAVANGADRDRLRYNAYFKFRIVDKDLLYLPLIAIPEVNPLVVGSTTATNSTILSAIGGGGTPMYKFPIPITLNPYENFTVEIDLSAAVALADATSSMDVYVILQGFMRRPT